MQRFFKSLIRDLQISKQEIPETDLKMEFSSDRSRESRKTEQEKSLNDEFDILARSRVKQSSSI